MLVSEITGNMREIVQALTVLADNQDQVRVDDGLQTPGMEADLKDSGLTLLIHAPQAVGIMDGSSRGAVKLEYSVTVWVRTNPKVQTNGVPTWDPVVLEGLIIAAVMRWTKTRNDFGFEITKGAPPETDWTDMGNNSRLIRFSAGVHFN